MHCNKKISRVCAGILVFCAMVMPSFGANRVKTIDIDAEINQDGSIYITQTWATDFSEGTESYIPFEAPDYLKISNLIVADKNGTYETLDTWGVDWDFAKKAGKCGINKTANGFEICFGISEYGENRYSIEYKLDGAIGGYSDKDGVNFRFVPLGMNTAPTDVNLAIHMQDGSPITDEIADIWGFGFDGQVAFDNGAIRAFTETPITAENHLTVMFALNKGIISPKRTSTDSFETVKNAAFEGSDYSGASGEGEALSPAMAIAAMGITILCPLLIFFGAKRLKKMRKQKRMEKFAEEAGYFRDLPNSGNTNATYTLGKHFEICEDGAILATGMLRLIDLGCLSPVRKEDVGFMGKTKETVSLKLMGSRHEYFNEYDEFLYTVLEGAAGADAILQEKELEAFSQEHDALLRQYISRCENSGREYINQKHCLNSWALPAKLKYLTLSGKKELGELVGFKKYLEDFSLVAERGVQEMAIWKEILSYAMLFGIADKVAEQMKELYPNIAPQVEIYSQSLSTAYSYQYSMYRSMRNAEAQREQAKRSAGSGGRASFGGGGGSIGGGTGGGTR